MSDLYARYKLSETNYRVSKNAQLLEDPPCELLQQIYDTYCKYKKFESVMPLFDEDLCAPRSDIIGYFDNNKLVAFSHYHRFNDKNVEAIQFAWDYATPKLHLGLKSLRHECAYYKAQGVEYIYVGQSDEYKKKINGFEICGSRF